MKYKINKNLIYLLEFILLIIAFITIYITYNILYRTKKILFTTPDGNFQVVEEVIQENLYIILYAKDDVVPHSSMLKFRPNIIVDPYIKLLLISFFIKPKITSALCLGLGGGIFTNILQKVNPNMKLDIVDNDYNMMEISSKYFNFNPTNKTKIYIEDGIHFIQSCNKKYDLIVNDIFSSDWVDYTMDRFTSISYLELIKSILNFDGLYVQNIIPQYNFHNKNVQYMKKVLDNFQKKFKYVKCYSTRKYFREDENYLVFASDVNISNIKNTLIYNLDNFGVSNDELFKIYKSE